MLFGEILAVAIGALRANKLRSMLTMLGIVIGVAAVIAMVALGTGAQTAVKERIASLGTTLLTVTPGQQRGMGVVIADQQTKLTMEDAEAVEERGEHITAVQPEMNRNQQITWANKNASASVVGTSANFLEVRKYKLLAGRMFTRMEDEAKQRLAVVGPAVATNMGLASPDALLGENRVAQDVKRALELAAASKHPQCQCLTGLFAGKTTRRLETCFLQKNETRQLLFVSLPCSQVLLMGHSCVNLLV